MMKTGQQEYGLLALLLQILDQNGSGPLKLHYQQDAT
jgi:hypothetical protein